MKIQMLLSFLLIAFTGYASCKEYNAMDSIVFLNTIPASCKEAKDVRQCTEPPQWFYNTVSQTCEKYKDGECGRTQNSFRTVHLCRTTCENGDDFITRPVPDMCAKPKMVGNRCLRGKSERWFYDKYRQKCSKFEFNGCGGNENNFLHQTVCQSKCAELFEGDIVMTKQLESTINGMKNNEDSKYDAIKNGAWPNAVIPFSYNRLRSSFRRIVDQAIQVYSEKTCIRWKKRTSERSYVDFIHGGGCYSMIGRQGGKQQISLGNGCGQIGVVIHEMMHALGFFHEQSRRDRGSYIRINWNNINRPMWYNFEMYKPGQASTLDEPYDKESVMHYGNYAFSTNRKPTIVSLKNPNEKLGQRRGLSVIDIKQLKKYYKCVKVTRPTSRPTTKDCQDNQVFCRSLAKWCSTNAWMKKNCKKTCGRSCKTKPVKPVCFNKNRNCASWARSGYCAHGTYKSYMQLNCKKSCPAHCT